MEDLNETTVTEAVLQQMADTPDPRLREIMAAAVKHLHAFAREVSLKPEEWLYGIKFMTEIGQALHAVPAGVHSAFGHAGPVADGQHPARRSGGDRGHRNQPARPVLPQRLARLALGDSITRDADREEIGLFGTVRDEAGEPVPDAMVEVWQTDPDGAYDLQAADPTAMNWRAQFRTDRQGRYWFRATLPLGYMIPMDGPVGSMITAQRRHGCRRRTRTS